MRTLRRGLPSRSVSQTRAALGALGLAPTRLTAADALREAVRTVTRSPLRTVLTSMGTVLAVGTAIATIGLASSASGAVAGTFNVLRATTVVFTDNNPQQRPPALTEAGQSALDRLHGVIGAGLMWNLSSAGSMVPVSRTSQPDPTGQLVAELPVTVASPAALATTGAVTSSGRLYDTGMDRRHDLVCLLGPAAASQLGITSVAIAPVIYAGGTPLTVVGILKAAPGADGALLGVVIPPGAAGAMPPDGTPGPVQMIVRTVPGGAQLIGKEGPYALDPYDPGRIGVSVPIDPTLLRNEVSGSLTSLLLALAVVALAVGVIAITNTTLLSVISRRAEIGLRRSVGAAPRHVAALVLIEAALVGAVGGVIGTSVGVLIVGAVSAARGWAPVLAPVILVVATPVAAAAGLLAGLYPAWRASRITPISALQR
jgi:putative ABC transport system permease protein